MAHFIRSSLTRFSYKNVLNNTIRNVQQKSSIAKDLLKVSSVTSSNVDFLVNDLRQASNTKDLLDIVNSHHRIMNAKHVIQVLKSMFILQKSGHSTFSIQQLLQHPDFERLCAKLKQHAGVIDEKDAIIALKTFTYLGVPSTTTIYQVVLQLIRHNINNISLNEIIFLEFLLAKVNTNPLVDALRIALPIVFQIQLPIKMKGASQLRLAEYLLYATKQKLPKASINLIIDELMMYKGKELEPKVAMSIVWSLCDIEYDEYHEKLFTTTLKCVIFNYDKLNFQDLDSTATKLAYKYNIRYPMYYNETFFDICGNVIVEEDKGFELGSFFLTKFLRVGHIHNNLINYMLEKITKNPSLVTHGDPQVVYSVVCNLAMAEQQPEKIQTFREIMMSIRNFDFFEKRHLHFVKFTMSLCVLNLYIPYVLRKCFNEQYMSEIKTGGFFGDFENILLINQAVKIFKPELSHYLPDEDFFEDISSRIRPPNDFPLKSSLMAILGGENYILTNIRTKLGHHIDHAIVLRKGGYPVAVNVKADKVILEDLEVPLDSQIVLILTLHPVHYTMNGGRLKGSVALTIRTLEAKGYVVFPICMESWKAMPDYEKLPYIMQEIKERSGNMEVNAKGI